MTPSDDTLLATYRNTLKARDRDLRMMAREFAKLAAEHVALLRTMEAR